MHKLGESFVDNGLVFVVILEDKRGEFLVVMEKISKGEHKIVFSCINQVCCINLILFISLGIPEFLNETSKF